MQGLLWRVLIAIVVIAVLLWLGPLVLHLIGLPIPGGDLLTVLKAVGGLLALLYIIWGPTPPRPWQ
jgi:hypothetical protein